MTTPSSMPLAALMVVFWTLPWTVPQFKLVSPHVSYELGDDDDDDDADDGRDDDAT